MPLPVGAEGRTPGSLLGELVALGDADGDGEAAGEAVGDGVAEGVGLAEGLGDADGVAVGTTTNGATGTLLRIVAGIALRIRLARAVDCTSTSCRAKLSPLCTIASRS